MKKEWKVPQVMGLGVSHTQEEFDENLNENAKIFHKCQYCGTRFWSGWERDCHEKVCEKNPNFEIGDMLPNPGEGGPIPTFS